MPGVTLDRVLAWRMERHFLTERLPAAKWKNAVSRICNLHAQVMSSAELTLAARVDGLDPALVERELWETKGLVKTWAQRGTLHLLLADELAFWTSAARTRKHFLTAAWHRYFGISADEIVLLNKAIETSLTWNVLTREELASRVDGLVSDNLGKKLRESWGSVLKLAAFQGLICFAPGEGQTVRFTRPDTWIGEQKEFDPEEALLDVLRRYLGTYGPADRDDFRRWWGIQPAEAGRLMKKLGDEIVEVDVEGSTGYLLREQLEHVQSAKQSGIVRLLPAFDQYTIGSLNQHETLLPGPFRAKVSRAQGWISPVLVVDGRFEGIWKHERKGNRLDVRIEPFRQQPASVVRAANLEAERLAAFLGGALNLAWES